MHARVHTHIHTMMDYILVAKFTTSTITTLSIHHKKVITAYNFLLIRTSPLVCEASLNIPSYQHTFHNINYRSQELHSYKPLFTSNWFTKPTLS